MKTNLIRAFVLTLAFAGFSASTVSANTTATVKPAVNVVPTPLCPPGTGDYCGMQ
jgi:hypothetical protein